MRATQALARFIWADIRSSKGRDISRVLADPNTFRAAHCYVRETTDLLTAHEPSLKALFLALSAATKTEFDEAKRLLSMGEGRRSHTQRTPLPVHSVHSAPLPVHSERSAPLPVHPPSSAQCTTQTVALRMLQASGSRSSSWLACSALT